MQILHRMSRHAGERSTGRSIPPGVSEMILAYGVSRDAGDGAMKFFLERSSMTALRRDFGCEIVKAFESYRRRGAYVVARSETIITVAFAGKPLSR